MALAFGYLAANIPGHPQPFSYRVSNRDLYDFCGLVRVAQIPPATYYTKQEDPQFGISRSWLSAAKDAWCGDDFDWRKHEKKINSYPNYKIDIKTTDGSSWIVHFAALFSKKSDATPVIFMHGWPGSYMEFFPMMDLLVQKYSPETLPYHIIVPSIPDYGFSSGPSKDVEVTFRLAGEVMNNLMISLGFNAYVAQGGDVGAFMAQQMCGDFAECKAFHLNLLFLQPSQMLSINDTTPAEQEHLKLAQQWAVKGSAYAYEHGTRPSTISLVLSTNPVAMLAWVGEKFIQWVDPRDPLQLDTILAMVTFYWFTNTFPRSMWAYRALTSSVGAPITPMPFSMVKPFGYSSFPVEISAVPKKWAQQLFPNLVTFSNHSIGGHFAALEQPEAFWQDVDKFLQKAKGSVKT